MLQLQSVDQQGQSFIINYNFRMNLWLIVACGCLAENGLRDDMTRIEHNSIMNHVAYGCDKYIKSTATNICCFSKQAKIQIAKNTFSFTDSSKNKLFTDASVWPLSNFLL